MQLKFEATDEQVKTMERNCSLTEALFARTLAKRIEGMNAEQSIPYIEDWFRSVRSMAQANLIISGIKVDVSPD